MEIENLQNTQAAARCEGFSSSLMSCRKAAAIPREEFNTRPAPGKWSKKELLGHLIDSASNNHHRLVRLQYQEIPHIVYHQDEWVSSRIASRRLQKR